MLRIKDATLSCQINQNIRQSYLRRTTGTQQKNIRNVIQIYKDKKRKILTQGTK